MTTQVFAVDFETYYDDDCTVRLLGPRAYCRHPKFDAYLVTVAGPEWTWAGHPADFDWSQLVGHIVVSHNAAFDRTVYDWLCRSEPDRFPVGSEQFSEWNCTANLTAFLCNRRALADAVKYLYEVDLSKQTRKDMEGQTWESLVAAKMDREVIEYAKRDAEWCRKLWVDLSDRWPALERRASLVTIESSLGGVAVDMPLVDHYLDIIYREKQSLERQLPWMHRKDAKATSMKEVAVQCRADGIPIPPVKTDDEEGHEEWLAEHSERFPWVKKLGEWRQVNKAQRTLETIKKRATLETVRLPDGSEQTCMSIDTPLKYFGAHTGRWSGDSGLNFQNYRKKPLVVAGEEIDLRRVFIARPGHRFLIADYSQIEPRCLAWISGDERFLKMVREGWSVYEAHAKSAMGWTGKNLKKTDPKLYALAKASRLGLGYGCGKKKFVVVAKALADLDLTEAQAEAAVDAFRDTNPLVVNLWTQLNSAMNRSLKGVFDMELPSGRSIVYPGVVSTREPIPKVDDLGKPVKDPKTGLAQVTWKTTLSANIGGRTKYFYGGKLCENLVQAVARDVFVEGLLRVVDAGYHVPFHVHDEVIVEVPDSDPVEPIVKLLEKCPDWIPGLPMAVEAIEAKHYQK